MGNCSSLHCIGKSESKPREQGPYSIVADQATHEGIKTVGVQKVCEFSTSSVLCVCIVTWNMNGKFSSEDLVELLGRDRRFDLLAVGLQEVPRHDVGRLLQSALVETHSLLGETTMQSLQLFVFGPKNSELYTREMRVDKHAVGGCGGMIGRKKGAVAMYINFSGIRMVFVSCHLAAHARNVEERNSQCRHISHSLFLKNWNPYARASHVTVWMGDLNYRLQGISTLPARSLIHRDLHTLLTSRDQLLQEAERGEVFNGYCEGTLSFKPTYKYDVGSSHYDTSHKNRVPSWTDRILFKIDSYSGIDAALHSYESLDQINSSDHKPVLLEDGHGLEGDLRRMVVMQGHQIVKDKLEGGIAVKLHLPTWNWHLIEYLDILLPRRSVWS